MQDNFEQICTSDISITEIQNIKKVLSNYDFNVLLIEKARSANKVYTDKGTFCLKKIGKGYKRALRSYNVVQHLRKNMFDHIPKYYFTKENNIFIRIKKSTYYLTYWIDGREISFNKLEEIQKSTELLAEFHLCSRMGLNSVKNKEKMKLKSNYYELKKTFKNGLNEILHYSMNGNITKELKEFDILYCQEAAMMKKEAELALLLINRPDYMTICDIACKEGYICHDSYYYQNILIERSQKLYLIDLESSNGNIPVSDLGKYIRRILTKKKYRWDFDLCRKIIESYNSVRPLCEEEYYTLLALIVFPHKFWRLGAKRYKKKKQWDEEKYVLKLKKLISLKTYKQDFIINYIRFYQMNIDENIILEWSGQ